MVLNRAEDLVSRGAHLLGLNRALRILNQKRLLVLNYHAVVTDECARDPLLNPNAISVSEFSRQMTCVARLFRPLRVSELPKWQAGMDRAVLITFDDGYRNNLTCAAPVLQGLGIPALIAICPGYIGQKRMLWPDEIHWRALWWPERTIPMPFPKLKRKTPAEIQSRLELANNLRQYCKRLPFNQVLEYLAALRRIPVREATEEVHAFLSWDEVNTLKSKGFDIASHTMEHPILAHLSREKLISELRDSKNIIEQRTGGECSVFTYPNGSAVDLTPDVVEEVKRAGYRFAFTVMGQLAAPQDDPLLLDRVYVPRRLCPAEFESRISGFYSALKRCVNG